MICCLLSLEIYNLFKEQKKENSFKWFEFVNQQTFSCKKQMRLQASSHWRHPDPARPDAIAIIHGTPVRHHAFPPLSAPPPTAGADLPPGHAPPHFGFPLQPTFGSAAVPPVVGPSGEGYPFIGSNPTVPLPTGMTDTTTVLPMPDTGAATGAAPKVQN